ncbi:MAG: glucose-1-phosphate adenylyltransferase subunit GlgD [Eubacteriales bacterium]|nr:glucose-1-phosphate adenylyltransferase subunit GlgD [Eubacteriales bacterium]
MFIDAMGLILADNKKIHLGELSRPRALAAIPFAGRYRIIDFMLSNMVNSGITNVGVAAMHKYKSLMDHIGTGSSWDLDRKKQGLQILPPYINSSNTESTLEGDDLAGLLDFLQADSHKHVILANSNVIFNTTFVDLVTRHEDSGSDITVLYNRDGIRYGSPSVILEIDRKGLVQDMMINPAKPNSNRCSMGVIVIGRELLLDLVSEMVARGEHDFSVEKLIKRYDQFKVRGLEYKGAVLRINSVPTYFNATMKILEEDIREELFNPDLPVYTKVKDEAPTLYDENNDVSNSVISDGCRILGSVTNSMIFRGATISRHAVIKNSIIMQDVYVSEGVILENVIIDKKCVIRPGIKLLGQADYPVVIGKGAIV